MIQPSELRIGNWYSDEYGGYRRLKELSTSIFVDAIYDRGVSTHSMTPIPLTEEILLKCGFEKSIIPETNKIMFTISIGKLKFGACTYYHIHTYDNEIYCLVIGEHINIEYLHQLQNIHFALTNKELEMEL